MWGIIAAGEKKLWKKLEVSGNNGCFFWGMGERGISFHVVVYLGFLILKRKL
jgi:hypothetical protein